MAKKKGNGGKKGGSSGFKTVAVAAAGGAVGAVGAALAARAGVDPQTAAITITVGGGAAALALSGPARWAGVGAAAAGASQLALAWLAKKTLEAQAEQTAANNVANLADNTRRQAALPRDYDDASDDVREEMYARRSGRN